jgi:hypothetical protein
MRAANLALVLRASMQNKQPNDKERQSYQSKPIHTLQYARCSILNLAYVVEDL